MATARELLNRYNLRPKKNWGQNFLVDENAKQRIVQAVQAGPDDTVVEIGAGLGAITQGLAAQAKHVVAVDRDPDMIAVLREVFAGNERVDVQSLDALDFDFAAAALKAGGPVRVAGNLPYQITTPLLFHVLGQAAHGRVVSRAVFMVQKEVADRLAAAPDSKIYGRLSVMVQQVAEVKSLFRVSPHAFLPQPKVVSTVFALTPRAQPLAAVVSDALFASVVRHAFGSRRKMLRRALDAAFGGDVVSKGLAGAGIDETRRAETLSVTEFGALTNAMAAAGAPLAGVGALGDNHEAETDDA